MSDTAVKLRINEGNLLSNLKYTFTNSTTFIGEMLQNARRAGATSIAVTTKVDGDNNLVSVSFSDDGHGIDDFQDLLTVAESGWDADTQEAERPFGMGFLSAIFAAKAVFVRSGQHSIDIEPECLLKGGNVVIRHEDTAVPGSVVELFGPAVDAATFRRAVESTCRGFPIPVTLDGQAVERPHAVDLKRMIETDVGLIAPSRYRLQDMGALPGCGHYTAYLQGLPIEVASMYGSEWVVHLDPSKFQPRMPDRDRVLDATTANREIFASISAAMSAELNRRRGEMGDECFVRKHWREAAQWCPELLCDIDCVPREALLAVAAYPRLETIEGEQPALSRMAGDEVITRHDFKSGRFVLRDLDCLCDPHEDTNLSWMLAWRRGELLIDRHLPASHWLHNYAKPMQSGLRVRINGGQTSVMYGGDEVYESVTFCQSWSIIDRDEATTFEDCAIATPDGILYPTGCGLSCTEVLDQVSNFVSDDRYDEAAADREHEMFRRFLAMHLSKDPRQTLQTVLDDARLGSLPHLHGKTFSVHFDSSGPVVDLTA